MASQVILLVSADCGLVLEVWEVDGVEAPARGIEEALVTVAGKDAAVLTLFLFPPLSIRISFEAIIEEFRPTM